MWESRLCCGERDTKRFVALSDCNKPGVLDHRTSKFQDRLSARTASCQCYTSCRSAGVPILRGAVPTHKQLMIHRIPAVSDHSLVSPTSLPGHARGELRVLLQGGGDCHRVISVPDRRAMVLVSSIRIKAVSPSDWISFLVK